MRTRLIVGGLLTLFAAGVFYGDHVIGLPFPFLALLSWLLILRGSYEFVRLTPKSRRPPYWVVAIGVWAVLSGHWMAGHYELGRSGAALCASISFAFAVMLAFLVEMRTFREPGESVNRIALAVLGVAYLGVLGGFFADIRIFQTDPQAGTLGMILAVFVPKGCDIGAYFTGKAIGRHKMSKVLSPNKTWEGAIGGLITATLVALAIQWVRPIIAGSWPGAAACGFTVGLAGMLGDLAESLMKRDSGVKDAANLIPGFGGLLDVIDAIIFAAPVSYLWLTVSIPNKPLQ
jgi:phosphatidate cytidylyltransferase